MVQVLAWIILGVLMFVGTLAAAAIWTAPTLVSDWRIHGAARPVADARVQADRRTAKLVFHICDAILTARTPMGPVSRSVNYVFMGLHFGEHSVRAVADPARPELAPTDKALDRLWNRTITLPTGAGVLLACTVLPALALVRRWHAGFDAAA